MKRNSTFIFFAAVALICSLIAYADDSYEATLSYIDKAAAKEDWLLADSLIVNAIDSRPFDPANALLMSNLGMVRFYSGRDSLALSTLNEAHRMAPASVTVLANRARVLTSMGRAADAIADYDAIERLDSTYSDLYLLRGTINLYSGYFELAERDFRQLDRLAPDTPETWIALASLYSITSRPAEAIPYYNKLIADHPAAEYYAARAMAHLMRDDLIAAADDIALGLDLDSEYAELYVARALLNTRRFQPDFASRDAATAVTLGADPSRLSLLLQK